MKSKKTISEVDESKDFTREQEDEEYVVEKICGRRVRKGKVSKKIEIFTLIMRNLYIKIFHNVYEIGF